MSTAILDRARAFDIIAPHLTGEKRTELATAIAGKLLAEFGKPPAPPAMTAPAPTLEVIDLAERDEHDQVAAFLAARGLTGAAQVKAAGRVAEFIAAHPNLTRVAAMQLWWAGEQQSKESL